jgi:hypothetical protein
MPMTPSVPPLENIVDTVECNNDNMKIVDYGSNWGNEDMRMGLD